MRPSTLASKVFSSTLPPELMLVTGCWGFMDQTAGDTSQQAEIRRPAHYTHKPRHTTHLHKLRAGLAVGHDEVSHRQQLVRHGTVVVVHCLGTLKVGGGLGSDGEGKACEQ